MNSRKTKKIMITVMAILMVIVMLLSAVTAYASEVLPENYMIDNTGIMSQYYIDLVDTVGKELESNGVKMVLVANKELGARSPNNLIRNQYYNWYGQVGDDKQLVVMNYYLEENMLVIFDENKNYVPSKTVLRMQSNLQRYKDKADMESGMYYAYSVAAEEIAKKLDFSLETTDTAPKYSTGNFFKSMPGIFAMLIVIVLALSFRKRKK